MVHQWEILHSRVDKFRSSRPLTGHLLFVIQHVLDDLTHLIGAFIDLGCDPQDVTVIGIPYSSRRAAGDALVGIGCRVILPTVFPMDGIVGKILLDSLTISASAKKPLIILEDGAYAVPQLCQMVRAGLVSAESVKGAVEQTTRGKWLDERVQRDGYLAVPVISIPDCRTKQTIEPPYIAQAVVQNLSALLNRVSPDRQVKALGMYGYGVIGHQVAKYFGQRGAKVYISDITATKRFQFLTSMSGFEVLDSTALASCDLVLGTTGSTSIGPEVISSLKNGTLLGSTSSRQIEVDLEYLGRDPLKPEEVIEPKAPCVMAIPAARRYTIAQRHGSKTVTVLYDGYPINFWGTSLPDHVADAVLSLLLEGVVAIAQDHYELGVNPGGVVLEDADVEITLMFREVESRLGFSQQ